MRRVLVLRPEPGASMTVERARERGIAATARPLFAIEPLAWQAPVPGAFDALLLTSANALRHGGGALGELRGLPAHAVGEATADAARQAGFVIASIGQVGVDPLLASLDPGLRLLHLCGEDRRAPMNARQAITEIAVYRARALPADGDLAAAGSVALIHSPRAGARFAELVDAARRRSIAIAAISPAAAQAVGGGWEAIETADRPSDEALLALAARLCNNSART